MTIIKNFPRILHGGDWNPDQWLEHPEIIDQDFELMDKAHCNTFSLGIFSWGQIEVEEGKYDFSWLDSVMNRCAERGKKVFLATPSAARPRMDGSALPRNRSRRCEPRAPPVDDPSERLSQLPRLPRRGPAH